MKKIIDNYVHVFKNFTNFNGRASRSEFWSFVLISIIIGTIISFVDIVCNTRFFSNLYSLIIFIPAIAVTVRRMHDVNKSGWFMLIPLYNVILELQKGTHGHNKYGDNPNKDSYLISSHDKK